MSLSTSNSKRRLAVKSIIVFLALTICYILAVPYLFPNGGAAQNNWQNNIIKANRYIYKKDATPFVIVGSSLSERLSNSLPDDNYSNLALYGRSSSTGLEIILRSKKFPKAVLIEINEIQRDVDAKMLKSLFVPVLYSLRRYLPALREEFQPASLVIQNIAVFLRPKEMNIAQVNAAQKIKIVVKTPPNVANPAIFAERQKEYSIAPKDELEKRIKLMEKDIIALMQNNVKVVFFETPVDTLLVGSPKAVYIRERMRQAFPPGIYYWIPRDEDKGYATADGTHLDAASTLKYADYLQAQVKIIMEPKKNL